jgi:hypothetical protein
LVTEEAGASSDDASSDDPKEEERGGFEVIGPSKWWVQMKTTAGGRGVLQVWDVSPHPSYLVLLVGSLPF